MSAQLWRRSPATLWRVVLDDVVVAAVDDDKPPLALSGGAHLWQALAEPRSLDELLDDSTVGHRRQEMQALLQSLVDARLVEMIGL